MTEFLVFLLIMSLLIAFAEWLKNKELKALAKLEVPQLTERTCPPHKWQWVEIKDHEGVTQVWKLRCAVCGPLKVSEQT